MVLGNFTGQQFKTCDLFGTCLHPSNFLPMQSRTPRLAQRQSSGNQGPYEALGWDSGVQLPPMCYQSCVGLQLGFLLVDGGIGPLGVCMMPFVIEARANTRTESAKIRNRRIRKKFNGTPTKPRLSVFCSDKQLYAVLVDDQNKKCLFYSSTLQKSIRKNPPCSKIEAAERVGNELVKTCVELNISEISQYDCNGFARGERMQAFETAIAQHGFLLP